ncbi:MAG TPA: ABC transporter substrate-binding protein [Gammaproteobacteria bacterium]|nr:ABC transporter substrate-binding protein [Gammaproteobacteria bacterium]
MRYFTPIMAGLLLLASSAWAWAGTAPQELVQQTSERMLSALKAEQDAIKKDPARVSALVKEIVLPYFDFERMSSWVLGKHWRGATDEQKKQFTEQFRALLIRTYATAMAEYSGQEINYLPFKGNPDAPEATVKTEIIQAGGPPIPISYSLYQKDGEWKVYDVIIDNTSLVANYRSSFANQIKRDGLDALIATLSTRSQAKLQADGASAASE